MASEKQSSSKGGLQCRVRLLDGSEFHLDLEKKEIGQFIFDQVLRRIGLSEKDKDYFGIEYEDDQKMPQWLDLQKQVKKQLKKPPFVFMFKVKYYPLDPVPHVGSRTHFYRQFRRDLISSKMRCPTHNIPDVIACILQADSGDFESMDQDIEFMTDENLIIDQSLESASVQDEVVKLHRLQKGKTPQEAVKTFLRKIRELDTYGVKLYEVKYDDSASQLGLSPQGVSLFQRSRRRFIYDWLMVSQISFKTKKFILLIEKDIGGDMQLVFELDSMKSAKELWSVCRQYAEFYTEPRRRVQEEPDQTQIVRSPGAQTSTASGGGDHFTYPAPPQPSETNQRDPFLDNSQKGKSLPRYLPTSNDSIAAALRINRRKKADSASPEHSTSTSPPSADGVLNARQEQQERSRRPIHVSHDQHHRSHDQHQMSHDQNQRSHDQHQMLRDQNQVSHDQHQQIQAQHQNQASHDQPEWSHDQPNRISHDQVVDSSTHYDSLNCRDEYLAQVQAQQANHVESVNLHSSAVPRPRIMSDSNPVAASRSHSTINPEDLSQEQDMDGSLLDLADELGGEEEEEEEERKESPRTGQNRHQGGVNMAMHANGHGGYHSHTLPHSFSGGGRSPRQLTDGSPRRRSDKSPQQLPERSPRQRTYGHGNDDNGPPKPPRTDYPHPPSPHKAEPNGGIITGNSPYLPGSSFTTGRQHQKKSKSLVRTWVQDQQLRAYHSSSSQDSSSAQGSPSHFCQRLKTSPDIRGNDGKQNGQSSSHSSAGSVGKSPGVSPFHSRSLDVRHNTIGSSPSREARSHDPQNRSHDQQQHCPPQGSPARPPRTLPSQQQVQPVKPVSQRLRSSPPSHGRGNVSTSVPKGGQNDQAGSSESPSPQPYRQRTSETLNHLQSDPQVPALIKEIDDLMGGLLDDSPAPERKEPTLSSPDMTTPTLTFEPARLPARVDDQRRGVVREHREEEEAVVTSENLFPQNINPADFLRDEDIRIDPRNFLNTPSPEPTLLDLKGPTATGLATGGSAPYQQSPLIGGILSNKLQEAMDEEADYHDPPPPPPHLIALTHGLKGPHGRDEPSGSKSLQMLQEAMDEEADYHDPPPPPPHLMALTHGLKGPHGRDESPGSRIKKQPPSVSPKPKLGSRVQVQKKPEQKKRPVKEPGAHYDPSDLPPEIAKFVSKVRNRSFDGGDSTHSLVSNQQQRSRPASGDLPRTSNEAPSTTDRPSSAMDGGQRTPVNVSPTYDVPRSSVSPTFNQLKVEVSAQSNHQAPATVERVTITPDVQEVVDEKKSAPSLESGRPNSAEMSPSSGSYSHSAQAVVYPEAFGTSAGKEQDQFRAPVSEPTSSSSGSASAVGGVSNGQKPGGESAKYTYAHYRKDRREQQQQQQQQFTNQNVVQPPAAPASSGMGWDSEKAKNRELTQRSQPQQQQVQPPPPHQQYQLRSQTNAPQQKNVSMSFPRGQVPMYGASPHHESHGSSDGSTPTTPHAQSDMAISHPSAAAQPRSPTGVGPPQTSTAAPDSFGYRYQSYAGQQQQPPLNARSRNYPPLPPQAQQQLPPAPQQQFPPAQQQQFPPAPQQQFPPAQQQAGYFPPGGQDIRRTQTFSMGQGTSRPTRPAHFHQHPGGEDSLPNSPTYFAQNPPPQQFQDRRMLSPSAMANNRSFQEHLEALNTTRHGRKMRVLDWMTKQQQVEQHHMVRDPSTELPAQPYLKQTHIYASAAELDPPPSSVHVPNPAEQYRPSSAQGPPPTSLAGGYQTQERGRLNTFPYSYSANTNTHTLPQQWPHSQAPRSQVGGRGGRSYVNVPPHAPPTGTQIPSSHQQPHGMVARGNAGMGRGIGAPVPAHNLPTAKFEKDYYILDV